MIQDNHILFFGCVASNLKESGYSSGRNVFQQPFSVNAFSLLDEFSSVVIIKFQRGRSVNPAHLEIDLSWASQVDRSWRIVNYEAQGNDLEKGILHFCTSHLMHTISRKLSPMWVSLAINLHHILWMISYFKNPYAIVWPSCHKPCLNAISHHWFFFVLFFLSVLVIIYLGCAFVKNARQLTWSGSWTLPSSAVASGLGPECRPWFSCLRRCRRRRIRHPYWWGIGEVICLRLPSML